MTEERQTNQINIGVIEQDIQEQLQINEAGLRDDMISQPTRLFYWGAFWARMAKTKRKQKLVIDELEATLSKDFRAMMLASDPTLRVTEKMLKEYVTNHPQYADAQRKLVELTFLEELLEVAVNAFKERFGLLLELAKREDSEKYYQNELRAMREQVEENDRVSKIKREQRKPKPRTPVEAEQDAGLNAGGEL